MVKSLLKKYYHVSRLFFNVHMYFFTICVSSIEPGDKDICDQETLCFQTTWYAKSRTTKSIPSLYTNEINYIDKFSFDKMLLQKGSQPSMYVLNYWYIRAKGMRRLCKLDFPKVVGQITNIVASVLKGTSLSSNLFFFSTFLFHSTSILL